MVCTIRVRFEIMKMLNEREVEIPESVSFDQFRYLVSQVNQLFQQQMISLHCDQTLVTEENFRFCIAQRRIFTVRTSV